jgi:restriction endonuclease S subunit
MWCKKISATKLFEANRWTVSYFTASKGTNASAFPMLQIRDVARERRGSADPQQMGDQIINYLGLENVRSHTGELLDFEPRPASSIKSRSKLFKDNDVLYGRLRPELNKVYLADGRVTSGLCSGEFIVITPLDGKILPRYLRHALASKFVTQYASKYKIGASLPRMSTEDLFGIEIPVPPLDVQEELVRELLEIDQEIVRLRAKISELPQLQADALLAAISSGTSTLTIA